MMENGNEYKEYRNEAQYGPGLGSQTGEPLTPMKPEEDRKNMNRKRGGGFRRGGAVMLGLLLAFGAGMGGGYAAFRLWGDDGKAQTGLNLNVTATSTGSQDEIAPTGLAAAAESVVEIVTTARSGGMSMMGSQSVTEGAGSGVIVTADGYIVTNNHVIEDADTIQIRLRNGETYDATLVGTDEKTDIALLKIEAAGLTAATIGSSSSLQMGDKAYVVGNPLGQLGGTMTQGIISALDREITVSGETMNLLQTDAAVNPGNSGGGLFNASGELVGIVVAKSIGTEVEGLGFAIPIDDVTPVLEELSKHGYVTGRPYMGATLLDITDAQTMMMYRVNRQGVYVLKVEENGKAAQAGLMAGDCILAVDGAEVASASQVTGLLAEKSVGDSITLTVLRNNQEQSVTVTLGEYVPSNS